MMEFLRRQAVDNLQEFMVLWEKIPAKLKKDLRRNVQILAYFEEMRHRGIIISRLNGIDVIFVQADFQTHLSCTDALVLPQSGETQTKFLNGKKVLFIHCKAPLFQLLFVYFHNGTERFCTSVLPPAS